MFRATVRSTPRALRQSSVASATGRRFTSTAPADRSYSWKGSAARWSLAIGALYWYNTSPIFADEMPSRVSLEPSHFSESDLPTIDAIVDEKRKQLEAKLKAKEAQAATTKASQQSPPPPPKNDATAVATPGDVEKTPEQLEEEAGQQGAFNPETGEINWDCPCLGGMAHGPCGEEFKAAFSCFVYSNEEPKGMDCIDKFQHMQDCFRKYPDVYGEEIADEEAAEAEADAAAAAAAEPPAPAVNTRDAGAKEPTTPAAPAAPEKTAVKSEKEAPAADKPTKLEEKPKDTPGQAREIASEEQKGGPNAEIEADPRGLPKRSFDATSANEKESK